MTTSKQLKHTELRANVYDSGRWEQVFDRVISPLKDFTQDQAAGGVVLLLSAILAMIAANGPLADSYAHLVHLPVVLAFGDWQLAMSLRHLINDGLMTLFFLVVGLELKRELIAGELSDLRKALLPIVGAVGGMVIPALIYTFFNQGTPAMAGWGVPVATDIAFAIGVMALLGSRVAPGLVAFLVALAIADDLGAVVIIALFYTHELNLPALLTAAGFAGIMALCNTSGIRHNLPYLLLGAALWLCLYYSGIHATLAGVITAMAIPTQPKFDAVHFEQKIKLLTLRLGDSYQRGSNILHNEPLRALVQNMDDTVIQAQAPSQRLEHQLNVFVVFVIVPLFAFFNAGVPLTGVSVSELASNPITLGVMFGLVLGKCLGITAFCWASLRLGLCNLPQHTRFSQLAGVGMAAGIGFTMSIFIAEIAFSQAPELVDQAKTGILFASLFAGICGFLWLYLLGRSQPAPSEEAAAAPE